MVLIFCTIPRMGMSSFLNIVIPLLVTSSAAFWPVVTITTPVPNIFFKYLFIHLQCVIETKPLQTTDGQILSKRQMRVSRSGRCVHDHIVSVVPANASYQFINSAHHHKSSPNSSRLVGYQISHRHAVTSKITIRSKMAGESAAQIGR